MDWRTPQVPSPLISRCAEFSPAPYPGATAGGRVDRRTNVQRQNALFWIQGNAGRNPSLWSDQSFFSLRCWIDPHSISTSPATTPTKMTSAAPKAAPFSSFVTGVLFPNTAIRPALTTIEPKNMLTPSRNFFAPENLPDADDDDPVFPFDFFFLTRGGNPLDGDAE